VRPEKGRGIVPESDIAMINQNRGEMPKRGAGVEQGECKGRAGSRYHPEGQEDF